jgi:hypothetical protein
MPKYEVIRAWNGVKVGDAVELADPVHPSLRSNVRLLRGAVADAVNLVEGDTSPADIDLTDKAAVVKELKRLKIQFDGRLSVEELAELLKAQ